MLSLSKILAPRGVMYTQSGYNLIQFSKISNFLELLTLIWILYPLYGYR